MLFAVSPVLVFSPTSIEVGYKYNNGKDICGKHKQRRRFW